VDSQKKHLGKFDLAPAEVLAVSEHDRSGDWLLQGPRAYQHDRAVTIFVPPVAVAMCSPDWQRTTFLSGCRPCY
jgi:hypothetical protein